MLGIREPELYGTETYADLVRHCKKAAARLGLRVAVRQSNHEGRLIDAIQRACGKYFGIVVNAGGLTHTSVALADALRAAALPVAEAHLTDIREREEFRKIDYVADVAEKRFIGGGFDAYAKALEYFARRKA